jgi:hypothetical protein
MKRSGNSKIPHLRTLYRSYFIRKQAECQGIFVDFSQTRPFIHRLSTGDLRIARKQNNPPVICSFLTNASPLREGAKAAAPHKEKFFWAH